MNKGSKCQKLEYIKLNTKIIANLFLILPYKVIFSKIIMEAFVNYLKYFVVLSYSVVIVQTNRRA